MPKYYDADSILKIIKDWQKIDTTNSNPNDDTPIYSRQDWEDWKAEFYVDVINAIDELSPENVVSGDRFDQLLANATMLDEALRRYHDFEEKMLDDEIQKVVHGEWLKKGQTLYMCSKCGRVIDAYSDLSKTVENFPYCHCGAKMFVWKTNGEVKDD